MSLWDLDDHYPQPVRISYLHLPQPPRLVSRELDNIHSGLFQLVSYGVDVSHLRPQTYTLAGPSARGARKLKEASSEEEDHAHSLRFVRTCAAANPCSPRVFRVASMALRTSREEYASLRARSVAGS